MPKATWRPREGTFVINARSSRIARLERISRVPQRLRHLIPPYCTGRLVSGPNGLANGQVVIWRLANCRPYLPTAGPRS